jgi:hypothetical protein
LSWKGERNGPKIPAYRSYYRASLLQKGPRLGELAISAPIDQQPYRSWLLAGSWPRKVHRIRSVATTTTRQEIAGLFSTQYQQCHRKRRCIDGSSHNSSSTSCSVRLGHWLIPSDQQASGMCRSDATSVGANKAVGRSVSWHRHGGQHACRGDARSGLIHSTHLALAQGPACHFLYHLALGLCTAVLGCRPPPSAEVQQGAANGCSPTGSGRRSLLMSCPGQASESKCNCYRVMPRLGTPLGPTDKPCIMGTPSP